MKKETIAITDTNDNIKNLIFVTTTPEGCRVELGGKPDLVYDKHGVITAGIHFTVEISSDKDFDKIKMIQHALQIKYPQENISATIKCTGDALGYSADYVNHNTNNIRLHELTIIKEVPKIEPVGATSEDCLCLHTSLWL